MLTLLFFFFSWITSHLHCRHQRPFGDIEQYVERISVLDDKYSLFMELKAYRKAAEVASKMRDAYKLQEVRVFVCVCLQA
jgi:hypothetical protein